MTTVTDPTADPLTLKFAEDAAFVRRALEGDESAVLRFHQEYRPALERVLMARGVDRGDATQTGHLHEGTLLNRRGNPVGSERQHRLIEPVTRIADLELRRVHPDRDPPALDAA